MKVENKSIFMGDDTLKSRHAEGNNKDKTQSSKALSGVAFKEKFDPIAQKKKKAMQQAMKIIGDAFAKETKLDDELNERRQKVKDLKGEIGDFNKEIRSIESEREDEKKLTEEILEDVADLQAGNMDLSNAQEQVKEMLSNLKILEEDIKGAAVDKEV